MASTLLAVAGLAVLSPVALADSQPNPVTAQNPTTVSADGLPTVQVNGVVWSQVVVGNTVYAAGKFTKARPAGAKAGVSEVVRNNLLAYDVTTGKLITTFAPNLNAQALVVTASPDGSRIYVGGDFTKANNVTRNRVAAYDTKTGALITTFAPNSNNQVRAIAATSSTVYLGGKLTAIGSSARTKLAAVNATNGALLPWAPVPGIGPTDGNANGSTLTSNEVQALVTTLGGSQVVAAGRFDKLNGVQSTGVGALDATTGATRPFAVNALITNQGINSSVNSLTTVNPNTPNEEVIGTAYDYYGPGNLEGSFTAAANGGQAVAFNDCHGDHYSAYQTGGVIYLASHAHDCANSGGFPEVTPRIWKFATAVALATQGVVGPNTETNQLFAGQPAQPLLNWFPTLAQGSFTGQYQAAWSVSGNGTYVVYGGEFPSVNGVGQQGLVRFALPDKGAPNKITPNNNAQLKPTTVSLSAGTARVSWQATFDNDNENLTYDVIRSDKPTTPVFTTQVRSNFWTRPTLGFIDTNLTPGATYTYRVRVTDPFNNQVTSSTTSVTVSTSTSSGGIYAQTVAGDSPSHYWRLDEPTTGGRSYDRAGFDDLTLGSGVTQVTPGALGNSTDAAMGFDGTSNGSAATPTAVPGPQQFSLETWFSTTSTVGGKIIGFGDAPSGNSSNYDRHIYLDNGGHVVFGVYPGFSATVGSPDSYNDGGWHHVVATLSSAGMRLYLDGQLVAQRGDVTTAQDYSGYWRLGGDTRWEGDSDWFPGSIDEAAVYPTALTAHQVQVHYGVGTSGQPFNDPPVAAFSTTTNGTAATFDGSGSHDLNGGTVTGYGWNFGDGNSSNGASTSAAHTYTAPGTYRVTLTVTDNGGATGTTSHAVTVLSSGTAGGTYSNAVLGDGAAHYWRLGEASGVTAYDWAGADDMTVHSGVTRGAAGAISGDSDTASTFDGSEDGYAAGSVRAPGPDVVSIEAWFKTTTHSGGKIVGYGNENTGYSSNYDRHIYMDSAGTVYFGVWTGDASTVHSTAGLNDGAWHHVVGELGPGGLALYVDGALADSDTSVTAGQSYSGYWRIGGDSSWADAAFIVADIDDVAIYPTELSAAKVQSHYTASGH